MNNDNKSTAKKFILNACSHCDVNKTDAKVEENGVYQFAWLQLLAQIAVISATDNFENENTSINIQLLFSREESTKFGNELLVWNSISECLSQEMLYAYKNDCTDHLRPLKASLKLFNQTHNQRLSGKHFKTILSRLGFIVD